MTSLRDRLWLFLATGFGSGYAPVAPGTFGTAAAAVLAYGLSFTSLPAGWTLAGLAVITAVIGIAIGSPVERLMGEKDPGAFVLDEFSGFYVALLVPLTQQRWPGLAEFIVAFLLFRLFDIIKPPPARWLQDLGGGIGIVLDDIAAGVYALIGVALFRYLFESSVG